MRSEILKWIESLIQVVGNRMPCLFCHIMIINLLALEHQWAPWSVMAMAQCPLSPHLIHLVKTAQPTKIITALMHAMCWFVSCALIKR